MFLVRTLYYSTLTVPLSALVYKWILVNLMLGEGKPCSGLASNSGGGGVHCRDTLSCFMLQKPEITAGLMNYLARMQTFPHREHVLSYRSVRYAAAQVKQSELIPRYHCSTMKLKS